MKSDIQALQDALELDVAGILWITPGPLWERPRPFEALDYFLDGLLNGHEKNEKTTNTKDGQHPEKNLFIGRSFGFPFFLAHLQEDLAPFERHLREVLATVTPFTKDRKKVLILGQQGKRVLPQLKKEASKLSFVTFEL